MIGPVTLLDVDNTLIFGIDTNELNFALLNSLMNQGITDLFLFTDMTFSNHSIQEREEIIATLTRLGFTVHGVLTPCDVTWDFLPDAEAQQLNQFVVDGSYSGKLFGSEFEAFIRASERQLPTVVAEALSYHPDRTPGKAYKEAAQYHRENEGRLSETLRNRSLYSKALSDNLLTRTNYTHTKGLMLDLFLRNRPSWVSSIVVADDNKKVIETITNFQPVEETTVVPVITIIPVTSAQLDEEYFDNKLKDHKKAVLKSALNKLNKIESFPEDPNSNKQIEISTEEEEANVDLIEVFDEEFELQKNKNVVLSTAISAEMVKLETTKSQLKNNSLQKKIDTLLAEVRSLQGKESEVDLINILAYTNSLLTGNGVTVEEDPDGTNIKVVPVPKMDLSTYKAKANHYSGSPNNSLRILGGLMLGLAIALTAALAVLASTSTFGIASIPAIGMLTGVSGSLLASMGSFAVGRRKGLSKAIIEVAESFEKSTPLEP